MIENLIEERLRKLERAKDAHLDPYPAKSKRTHTLAEARKNFGALLKAKKGYLLSGG